MPEDGLPETAFPLLTREKAVQFTVRAAAPVLTICRKLIAAGFDSDRPLNAYRGEMLCIIVKSIGKAAALTVDEHNGTRFAKWKAFSRSAVSSQIAQRQLTAITLANLLDSSAGGS